MKKSLVALAALAVAGIASAQSSVTLFGVLDAAVSGYSNKSENRFGSATVSSTQLSNSGYNASRLGFRGTEDLGGGLAASFWLEAGINNDDGTGAKSGSNVQGGGLSFSRRSTVSLSGNFGEVRLGRDYTPTFWNDTVFDPFGTNGVGTNLIYTATNSVVNGYARSSNSVGYFLPPNLGGFYGQFMYAFNEQNSYDPGGATPPGIGAVVADPALFDRYDDARKGRYIGGRVGYANGPLDVALSYGDRTVGSAYYLGATERAEIWNLGASYDFGVVKLFGEYSNNRLKTDFELAGFNALKGSDPKADGWLLGVTVPVGAGLIRASYSGVKFRNVADDGTGDPKADKFAIGYVHNLSKRTALYTSVAYLKNKNGANLTVGGPAFVASGIDGRALQPKTSTGYDIGLRHAF